MIRRSGDPARRILVCDDEEGIRFLLNDLLVDEGYAVDTTESGEAALTALDRELYDAVLLDLNLPGIDGIEVLNRARSLQTDAQFIMMTAFGSLDSAVEAMKLGAFDYVRKPFNEEELLLVLERALRETELRREMAQLRRKATGSGRHGIIGSSPAIRRMFDLIERVAPTRASVLITGETGTGKELVARAIHNFSDRAHRPFIPVNCSALPETLLESELFGHVKGSFTGAIQNKRGLFEDAAGGTLFLDEIGTVSANIQVKLLRVLQERRIKRVGGREEISVDFRLLAATNMDVRALVEEGDFREDLFYRLNVFPIRVPALRERASDIPLLADYFRMRFGEENGIDPPLILPETMARMVAHTWPGNVRELENFIERAVIMHSGARTLPFDLPRRSPGGGGERALLDRGVDEEWDLERLEREYILAMLERTQWHQGAAAEILGVNRRTLYRRLKRYREEGWLPEVDGGATGAHASNGAPV